MEELLKKRKAQLNKKGPPKGEPVSLLKEYQWTKDKLKISPLAVKKYNHEKKEWQEQDLSTNTEKKNLPCPSTLNVITYNIWIKEVRREERINSLVQLFEQYAVDIVAIEETTPQAQMYLESHPIVQNNFYVSSLAGQQSMYKIALLSKIPFSRLIMLDLPFLRAPRKAIWGEFNFQNNPLCFVAVHLESDANLEEIRAEQIKWIIENFDNQEPISPVILGDFNFQDADEEKTFIDAKFKDAWLELKKSNTGGGTYGVMRLDRVYLRTNTWRPKHMEVINNKKPPEISDHKGLFVVLESISNQNS